jgi:hypothetical protein
VRQSAERTCHQQASSGSITVKLQLAIIIRRQQYRFNPSASMASLQQHPKPSNSEQEVTW